MGERIRKREGYRKEVFKWATENRCGTSYLTHTNTGEPAHTHTNTKPSEVWNVVWPPQIFAPVLSWRCSSLLAFKCHSLPVFTSLTLFCLWICLNLFRMHLDILTPGCIGEIEGMRMRESHRNREWLREKSHRYWARWQANKGRKGKKGQTQTEVQKIFHTLELKWLNARAQRALTHYRWRIKVHFCISGKRSCQVVWTSFTCFCERPFSTLHPKHLYRATGTCRGGGGHLPLCPMKPKVPFYQGNLKKKFFLLNTLLWRPAQSNY